MSEWIDFDLWNTCISMERPGVIFQIVNADAHSIFTQCTDEPTIPFDWTSDPVAFRAVAEPEPQHSTPLPQALVESSATSAGNNEPRNGVGEAPNADGVETDPCTTGKSKQ